MEPQDLILNVNLLNGRDYVQGTQMIARVGELLGKEEASLTFAKFHQLTNHLVFARLADSIDVNAIGSVIFKAGQLQQLFNIYELPEPAIEKLQRDFVSVIKLQHDQKLNGSFSFVNPFGFEDMLNGLIQGVKLLHLGLPQEAEDVWFTGVRNFALPFQRNTKSSGGSCEVRLLRLMSNLGRHQSLMKVSFDLEDGPSNLGELMSFAFRYCGKPDVH